MTSEFRLYVTFSKYQLSIFEIAEKFTSAFKLFSEYDNRFNIIYIHLPKDILRIDLSKNQSTYDFAGALLKYNLKDIKKYDALIEPTIQYKREFGFSLGFNFENFVGENILSLHALIGGDSLSINYKMNETPIKQIEKFSAEWYHEFIESLIQFLPIQFAVVRPRNTDYLDKVVTIFKYPIGLVTYFGNEILEIIPQIYDTFDCEFVAGGRIISLSEALFESKEGLDSLHGKMVKISDLNSGYLL